MEGNIVMEVAPPKSGRRFAVGDVHGCVETFKHLVEETLQLTQNDQLFPLGDYIDRGPNSAGVIEYILHLQAAGYQVYPIKGNHEDMFLGNYEQYCLETDRPEAMRRACSLYGCESLLDKNGRPFFRYLDFMEHLPHCIELEHCYLVHAGFAKDEEGVFADIDAMLWQRTIEITAKDVEGRFVIHGHTPTDIKAIRKRVEKKYFDIPLDNGCVFYNSEMKESDRVSLGRLCALDLDSMKLYEVACIDDLT